MAAAVTYSNFGGMLVHEHRAGAETFYVPDTLGSMAVTLDVNNSVSSRTEYWPYGEEVNDSGSNPSDFGFVGLLGYLKDLLDKLLSVRARHLTPDRGQWLTTSRIWPTENLFGYAGSAPTLYTDPSGNETWKQCVDRMMQQLLTPYEACVYCCATVNHYPASTCKDLCKSRPLPKPIGPPRPGPVPTSGPNKPPDPPDWMNVIVTACGSQVTGSELLGPLESPTASLCVYALSQLKKLELSYCEEPYAGRSHYPGASDQFWDNYCDYLNWVINTWKEYCQSHIK